MSKPRFALEGPLRMYTVDLLVEGRPVESIAAQDVVDLKARMEKLERVAQEARRLMSGVHDEDQVQTVYYACGCWTPEVKCPGCALQEALVALDGDGND